MFTWIVNDTSCDPGDRVALYGIVIFELEPLKNALVPSNVTFCVVPLFAPIESCAFEPSGHVDTTAACAAAGIARSTAAAAIERLMIRIMRPLLGFARRSMVSDWKNVSTCEHHPSCPA